MIPLHCAVKHDPENGLTGDCLRTCIASLLDYTDATDVPHFTDGGVDGETAHRAMSDWLRSVHNLSVFTSFCEDETLGDVLALMAILSPDTHYMLFGKTANDNPHVVIGKGGEIVHDPAWLATGLVAPLDSGVWVVKVLARP